QSIHRMLFRNADGLAVECYAKVFAHSLYLAMPFALKPWEHGVAREEIHPAFQRCGNINPQFERALHHRRARIRRENVGPELRAWILAANVHDEPDGFA